MVSALQGSRVFAARPLLTLLAVLVVATSAGGCWKSPRFKAPFTLANPNERHPIAVRQGEVSLDLAVFPGASGLNESQKGQLYGFLRDYKSQSSDRLLVRAPSGGANETAAMRAYDEVRRAMRSAGINPAAVALEPYFGNGDPAAPLRLSYLQFVAEAPDCPDWSEDTGRDPQNMPWTNKGCATQRNLAASVADARDLLGPRGETPRPGERRDVVWGKYIAGEPTISKRAPSERANASEISQIGTSQ
ncbi:MAG: CpaD family pilus assembly protein [Methyloceanibacter sp.]